MTFSGERVSNVWVTYLGDEDSGSKGPVILNNVPMSHDIGTKWLIPLWDRPVSYQLVGEVTAYQGNDG